MLSSQCNRTETWNKPEGHRKASIRVVVHQMLYLCLTTTTNVATNTFKSTESSLHLMYWNYILVYHESWTTGKNSILTNYYSTYSVYIRAMRRTYLPLLNKLIHITSLHVKGTKCIFASIGENMFYVRIVWTRSFLILQIITAQWSSESI